MIQSLLEKREIPKKVYNSSSKKSTVWEVLTLMERFPLFARLSTLRQNASWKRPSQNKVSLHRKIQLFQIEPISSKYIKALITRL